MRDILNIIDYAQIEDVGFEQMKRLLEELNDNYTYDQLFENWSIGVKLKEYLKLSNGTDPVVGKNYYLISALWMPASPSTGVLDLYAPDDKLLLVHDNGDYLVFKDASGNIKRYPEFVGSISENIKATLLYKTLNNRNSVITAIKLKFDGLHWHIKVRH